MDEEIDVNESDQQGRDKAEDDKMENSEDMDLSQSPISDKLVPPGGGSSQASDLPVEEERLRRAEGRKADGRSDVGHNKIMKRVQKELKTHLIEKFAFISEGTSSTRCHLKNMYTRIYIAKQTDNCARKQHEVLHQFKIPSEKSPYFTLNYEQIDCLNIFKPGKDKCQQGAAKDGDIRIVMTKGIAGIGKTVAIQNFSLNWAEGKSNQDIDLIFVLPFRELNMLKEGEYSLLELLLHFYREMNLLEDATLLLHNRVLFIFDGLDESRFLLDFKGAMRLNELDQRATVDVLLTNLIKGDLLPNALLWVTSRPAAASQIPLKYIDQMTEIQGFTDDQREEYFVKRFSRDNQDIEILSHIKGMISFYFMGHIPIFCWITAEVFKEGWHDKGNQRITTMTELYIYYLLIQSERTAKKHARHCKSRDAEMLLKLSKLAFEQLQQGNVIFYEEDLSECGIDADQVTEFCGFCSEVLKEEHGLYQKGMLSFVHLSFQEFLAALHVFLSCVTKDSSRLKSFLGVDPTDLGLSELQQRVVDKALQSEKGQLDLFLCFFLGFTLKSNQTLLQGLLPQIKSDLDTVEEMKRYLRNFHAGTVPTERCLNLLLCKFELKEDRFQDDIAMFLQSGVRLLPIDCSILATMLQISGEVVEELDLTKSFILLGGVQKLLHLLRNSKRALLKGEHVRGSRCATILAVLQSPNSCLRELSVVGDPCSETSFLEAVGGPLCKLETLRLSRFALEFQDCHLLTRILQFKQSSLRVLDLTDCIYSYPEDYSGYFSKEGETDKEYEEFDVELSLLTVIPAALISPVCKLTGLSMPGCHLKNKCGQVFASVLCANTQLRELDLSRNDLRDLGVQLLSVGLGSSKCRLEVLRLSCCGITEEGCVSLASALKSNPSHLRELDLSFNYPGESGVKLLSERLLDPECRMEKLIVDHNEEHWVNPNLLNKYACDLTLDPNTVNEHLLLSECKKEVYYTKEKQSYPDHPERFDQVHQVMCREGLTGRCYWEVDWEGLADIGVAYKSLKRKGDQDTEIEFSNKAWCFSITYWSGYTFSHKCVKTFIYASISDVKAFLARPRRLGVFLDWPAGILSFYSLSGSRKTLLHTFFTTFTEPLYPTFTVYFSSRLKLRTDHAWSSFTPEVIPGERGVSYRFTFPSSGVFQCSLTRLVFKATHEGEVTYKTMIWDETLLRSVDKVPGGPLFSIECSQGSVCQLHLPHCEPDPALVSESLSVVHVTDDGLSMIQPLEITATHVVVDTPHLSAFGIVWNVISRFVNYKTQPVCGQVLLFLRPMRRGGKLILNVLLLPSNVPLQEVKVQHENSEYIQAPSYCLLHKETHYSLRSDPEGYKIQPTQSRFFENYGPNYHPSFEIILTTGTEEITLMVEDPDKTRVWVYNLHLPDLSSRGSADENQPSVSGHTSAKEKLRRSRSNFIDRVSDPVLSKLLDELLHSGVFSDVECEAARAKTRRGKAEVVIDMVRNKGAEASSVLITALSVNDPFLCKELGLEAKPAE